MPSDIRDDEYGKYKIKSLLNGELWQARAFYKGKVFGEIITAASREAAIEAVEAQIDELGTWPDPSNWTPSADLYRRAFAGLGHLPGYQHAMLKAHLAAPDNIMTATELAKAGGYNSYVSANSLYGKLGRRIAEHLGWVPEKREDGTPIWTFALATDADEPSKGHWSARQSDGQHWRWQLRPEAIEAATGSVGSLLMKAPDCHHRPTQH